MYGWRGKIGLLVPMTNTTMELECRKLAPDGIMVCAARMLSLGGGTVDSLFEMEKNIEAACDRLAFDPDIIVFGCTTGSLIKGLGWDKEIIQRIEKRTKKHATTTSTAVINALAELKIVKVAVATPYGIELNEKVAEFLEAHGFDVVSIKGLNLSPGDRRKGSPYVAYKLARQVDRTDADGIFISCTNFRTIEIIEKLEGDLEKPVITSNQATMWQVIRKLKVHDLIGGYGILLKTLQTIKLGR